MPAPRLPDRIFFSDDIYQVQPGEKRAEGWTWQGTEVHCRPENDALAVEVRAEGASARRVILRWEGEFPARTQFLGDHWERGYGDLAWRGFVPERVMPWYFLHHAKGTTGGWGVKTGASAICFWTADPGGISLWLDLRCGTEAVQLAGRALRAAEVVTGQWEDLSAFAAATAFCRMMCPRPRLPSAPVYGGNDWYYAYGSSTHETLVRDAALLSDWAGSVSNRPYSVIDDGWQSSGSGNGSPWRQPHANFPDMRRLAREIAGTGCRPGLWFRPLLTRENVPAGWTLPPRDGFPPEGAVLDPSVPEVLEKIRHDFQAIAGWGYALIKHDFTTFELLMKWGFEMGPSLTVGTWKFADGSRTTAEIIADLYRAIRQGAGEAVIIGCNTIGHLGAGLFEVQRTEDDTSGRNWERTRRMGLNTLAFRMPQHETFFAADADCVGLTGQVPWELNRPWLSLLAESGTPLFVSANPAAVGPEQKAALKAAFAVASQRREPAEPLDWMETTCPRRWKTGGEIKTYDWSQASPFIMP